MNRKRGLGSGLDALIPAGRPAAATLREVHVDHIRPNRNQPRTSFDEQALEDLAASIREHGLIQPLIVSELADGEYELIAGERRWRAARRAELITVPVIVKDATPLQLLELALVENIQRADLNPLEEGMAYQTLKDEFGLTDDEIARRVSKSRVAVVNARRLIRLVPAAQKALIEGVITAGHGRALLRLEDHALQTAVLTMISQRDMSVREAERLADLAQHEALAPTTRQALLSGALSMGHGHALLRIADTAQQAALVEEVLATGIGVRETEQLAALLEEGLPLERALARVRGEPHREERLEDKAETSFSLPAAGELMPQEPQLPPVQRTLSVEDAEIQRMFEEALGTPVRLSRSGGSMRLTITVYNDEQLQALYEMVSGTGL